MSLWKNLSASLNWWSSAKGNDSKPSYIRLHLDFSEDKQEKKKKKQKYWDSGERLKPLNAKQLLLHGIKLTADKQYARH